MVSVIIPCHNCADFVDRAISSVIGQTYTDLEIILVENNSTDNTMLVLLTLQQQYPNLITVYTETKKGAPAARNLGLAKAQGDWIQFLDADDELLKNKIARQLTAAEKTGADIIAGACKLEYAGEEKTKTIKRPIDRNTWRGLITSNLGITSSNLWRRESLLKVHGWDEAMSSSQEYDLLFRLLKNGEIVATTRYVDTVVHFSQNSVSKSVNKDRFQQIINNRIDLRLRIKRELRYRSLLTRRLKRAIDTYIYLELMNNYQKFPEYANSMLQLHHLKLSPMQSLQIQARGVLSNFKNSLSKIFSTA